MIIIGDLNIQYENIEKISSIKDIEKTSPNATVLFDFDFKLLQYTKLNDIESAIIVHTKSQYLKSIAKNSR